MAGIKIPLNDVLAKLATLTVVNGDGASVPLYSRIWNNQIRYEEDGKLYNFPKPAAFVEIVSPATFDILGQGYRSCDISFRIHLSHENYNTEGTFEQDLKIFELRDAVVSLMNGYRPTSCGPMEAISEGQDYEHANTYHYIIDFLCNFTDDVAKKQYILTTPPTALEQTTVIAQPKQYIIPQS